MFTALGDLLIRFADSPRSKWLVAAGICCIYLACLFLLPARPVFWSPDEGGKYLTLSQIMISGPWSAPLPYLAATLDRDLEHVPQLYWLRQDHTIYSWWSAWFPAVSIVPYSLFGVQGLNVLPLLSSLIASFAVYTSVLSASRRLALGAMVVTAMASPFWFYGLTFWEHTLQALLVLLGTAAAIRACITGQIRWYAASGILIGFAFYFRLETVIFLGAVGLTCTIWASLRLRERREAMPVIRGLIVLCLCFLATLGPFLWHNTTQEGYPLGRRNALDASRTVARVLTYGRQSGLEILPDFLVGSIGHQGVDLKSPLRWMFVLASIGCALSRRLLYSGLELFAYLSIVTLTALCGLVLLTPGYRSVHGLILIAPYVAFVGWSWHAAGSRETSLWGIAASATMFAFLIATAIGGWQAQGGLQWGMRYALPLFALLIVATTRGAQSVLTDAALSASMKRILLGSMVILALLGAAFQFRGVRELAADRWKYVSWEQRLSSLQQDSLIVTEHNWLALTLPEVYETRAMLWTGAKGFSTDWRQQAYQLGFRQICQAQVVYDDLQTQCLDLGITAP